MEEDQVLGVWYAAYGSNMHLSRLRCYLAGGTPEGGALRLPGCRNPADPRRSVPILLPGQLYFATESLVWTGGRAFLDPDAPGETASRAYLLTTAQFSDIAAQEMYRAPGADLDLTEAISIGRATLGPGRYETLVCAGNHDGYPILTFTAPWHSADVPGNPPSAAYLRHLSAGIVESHGWTIEQIAVYLARCPGARIGWTAASIVELLSS
ncbi:histone deacetylase [Nocardia australiensis]|uniref:histone deacetylase n=1 Tax=Nocardia australiensis TaxID=2887191 RepID=UPI001D150EAA|nr:histone deacetylase [Nocardia australiensis]